MFSRMVDLPVCSVLWSQHQGQPARCAGGPSRWLVSWLLDLAVARPTVPDGGMSFPPSLREGGRHPPRSQQARGAQLSAQPMFDISTTDIKPPTTFEVTINKGLSS